MHNERELLRNKYQKEPSIKKMASSIINNVQPCELEHIKNVALRHSIHLRHSINKLWEV